MNSLDSRWQDAVAAELASAVSRLQAWAAINSGSDHEAGLNRMRDALHQAMADLPGQLEVVPCPGASGDDDSFPRFALRLRRESNNPAKPILLNGHYDTVYGAAHRFQSTKRLDGNRLQGPGVTDMKGGLVVLLSALKIWESSPLAGSLAWEVLITPDEEIGSPFSIPLLEASAARCRFGLIFESAYADGGFVRTRKGSAVYQISAAGRSAHVGRNPEDGRNAILGLSEAALAIGKYADTSGIIANLGDVSGGGPLNVVPDAASMAWNVRASTVEALTAFETRLSEILAGLTTGFVRDIRLSWTGGVSRPPKVVDAPTQALYDAVASVAAAQGLPVNWRDTGGGSDGSNLAAYGLPNLDNLGVRGGAIHSDQEYVLLDSLPERIALTLGILEAARDGRIQL